MPLTPAQHDLLDTLIMGNEGELDDPKDPFAGATLTVYPAGGRDGGREASFYEPLARMWRHEPDEDLIWLRPVVTHPNPGEPISKTHRFPLAINRRRGLTYTTVTETEHGLRFDNTDLGITAYIEPIDTTTNRRHAERLVAWDTFTLAVLPEDIVETLETLTEDDWHDEWA